MGKAFHSGSGTDERPPFAGAILSMDRLDWPIGEERSAIASPPNAVSAGKVPPGKLHAFWEETFAVELTFLHADFSIFPPAETLFRIFLATSHDEWRRAER